MSDAERAGLPVEQHPATPEPVEHVLKTWPVFFRAILDGTKTFELRVDDRGFKVGDTLRLREYDPDSEDYSGREVISDVTYRLPVPGTEYVVLGLTNEWREELVETLQQLLDLGYREHLASEERMLRNRAHEVLAETKGRAGRTPMAREVALLMKAEDAAWLHERGRVGETDVPGAKRGEMVSPSKDRLAIEAIANAAIARDARDAIKEGRRLIEEMDAKMSAGATEDEDGFINSYRIPVGPWHRLLAWARGGLR